MSTKIKSQISEFIYPFGTVTPSCHASTVLPLPGGNVVAAWFGGTREGCDDVRIWVSLRENGLWSTPYPVSAPGIPLPHWNPALFLRKDGLVCLYFKYGKDTTDWVTYYALSGNGGKDFSTPRVLVPGDEDGGRGPVKNKPIRLKDGTVLAPASKEHDVTGWECFVDISKDDGQTFIHSDFIARPLINGVPIKMIQPTLWEDNQGVHALLRTDAGHIYRTDSKDGGMSWCEAYPMPYLNPNSGIDLATLSDGSLILASNPVGKNWGTRSPLTLMRSCDGGSTFEEILQLESATGSHEFSYPAIVAVDNTVYVTYTYERQSIKFWQIEFEA